MKTAILSDIHGNMEAFSSVLRDIEQCHISRIFCLGDCIGYGPEPHKVLEKIKKIKIATVLGNHELAMLRPGYLSWFNPIAQKSLKQTRNMLTTSNLNQIALFPRHLISNDFRLVHGFPPNLPKMYLFQASEEKLMKTFQAMTEKFCFIGHTHQLEIITYLGNRINRRYLQKETIPLDDNCRHMINVGSVGQPRDGNNNAKYVIWDATEKSIEVRFVPYDIAATVAKIKQAGLPEVHAKRLW